MVMVLVKKHNIHHPRDKHVFAKKTVSFDILRIVNNCLNLISDKINTHHSGLFWIYKNTFVFTILQGKLL